MPVDRRWYWFGAALVVAGVALVAGLPLRTLLYVAALLACPAAMFFGMGMMGGPRGREPGTSGPEVQPRLDETGMSAAFENPVMILKRRLATGEITIEEYERLALVVSSPNAAVPRA